MCYGEPNNERTKNDQKIDRDRQSPRDRESETERARARERKQFLQRLCALHYFPFVMRNDNVQFMYRSNEILHHLPTLCRQKRNEFTNNSK